MKIKENHMKIKENQGNQGNHMKIKENQGNPGNRMKIKENQGNQGNHMKIKSLISLIFLDFHMISLIFI